MGPFTEEQLAEINSTLPENNPQPDASQPSTSNGVTREATDHSSGPRNKKKKTEAVSTGEKALPYPFQKRQVEMSTQTIGTTRFPYVSICPQ